MSNKKLHSITGLLDFPIYDLPETVKEDHNFLGQGNKDVIVIAKADDVGNGIEFLQSVLSPLGINYPEDPYILITSNPRVSFTGLCQNYDFSKLLLFGVDPKSLGLQISTPFYHPINLVKKQLIFVESIEVFTEEKAKGGPRPKAKNLWLSLKSFFEKS